MSLMILAITLVVVGVLLWLVNTYMPMVGRTRRWMDRIYLFCLFLCVLFATLIFIAPPAAPY